MLTQRVREIFLVSLTALCLSSCSSWLNIGASDFDCPHVRSSRIRCIPPSVIETLDERGQFDWRWHPICEEDACPNPDLYTLLESSKKNRVLVQGTAVPHDQGTSLPAWPACPTGRLFQPAIKKADKPATKKADKPAIKRADKFQSYGGNR